MQFKFVKKEELNKLPVLPGVYAFKSKKGILYIGKAVNIKERVKNHFSSPNFKDEAFIPETEKLGYITTDSEIEALILEAELIHKYQPDYNTLWKDGKSYYYIAKTKEKFPKVLIIHQTQTDADKTKNEIGPFIDSKALRQTLKTLRRVFPFRTCNKLPKKPCLYKDLKLCPAPCETNSSVHNSHDRENYVNKENTVKEKEYNKNIKNIFTILKGGKSKVTHQLEKEMRKASSNENYEMAAIIRNQLFSLKSVFQNSKVLERPKIQKDFWPEVEKEFKKLLGIETQIKRVEAFDVSNIQGHQATASMVVFENGMPNKNEYRKFKIKITGKPNDIAMLKEAISRRSFHNDWKAPQIILIDGGIAQLNAGITVKFNSAYLNKSKIISLAKRKNELFSENQEKPILLKTLPRETANFILHIRDEAHRFAISYHRKLRLKDLLNK